VSIEEHQRPPVAVRETTTRPRDYVEVGAHVASVLAAAEQAAVHIRQEAKDEASEIRDDARQEAARIRQDAAADLRDLQRQRSELEKYTLETRAAADDYADKKRGEGDADAAKIKAEAEGQARSIVKDAEVRARGVEDAARRRGAELERESQQIEERLRDLMTTSRELAEHLETRLARTDRRQADSSEKGLEEALKPKPARKAASSG
jgi:hypothetical protein